MPQTASVGDSSDAAAVTERVLATMDRLFLFQHKNYKRNAKDKTLLQVVVPTNYVYMKNSELVRCE